VEVSCTGKPVEINVSPWTYFGNGATVAQGREGEVSWLTRSFTGPGYDWESQATMALHVERSMEGSTAGTVPSAQGIVAEVPTVKAPLVVGGRQLLNKETRQYSKPFQGQIHALDLYDHALTEDEIAKFHKGREIEGKPIFTTRHSELGPCRHVQIESTHWWSGRTRHPRFA
jgi:hypothetical protein